jgi:cell division protein ZapA
MTALNLARELLALKGDAAVVKPDGESVEKLRQIGHDIDQTLNASD